MFLPESASPAGGHKSRQRVERDHLEREPCARLSDTRVVRLDVRVIAEVGIRYTDVRSAKDHVVERIQASKRSVKNMCSLIRIFLWTSASRSEKAGYRTSDR